MEHNPDIPLNSSPRLRGLSEPPKSSRVYKSPQPDNKMISKWTDDVEKVIKDIGDSCIGYKWMSILAAKQTTTRYDILMYLIILIGPAAGVFTSVSVSYPQANAWLQIIATVLSFFSGVVSTSLKFSQLEEKSSSFKQIAAKYASLESNIRRQLSLGREERVIVGDYLEWVSSSFDELFASTPLMPDNIYQKWVEFAKINNLVIPKELGRIITVGSDDKLDQLCTVQTIEVNTHSDSRENTIVDIHMEKKETVDKKRSDAYNGLPDLNRFTDGKMKYEMSRLFGVK